MPNLQGLGKDDQVIRYFVKALEIDSETTVELNKKEMNQTIRRNNLHPKILLFDRSLLLL